MLRSALGVSVGWLGISMVNDGLPALLLPHLLLSHGQADATVLGLITLVAIGLAAAVQPFAGRWSDRAGRFPVIGLGVLTAILGLGLMLAPGNALLGALVALGGVSVAQAGYQPLLPDRIGAGWHGRAGGLKSAFDVGGALLGFVLLAALLGSGQPGLGAIAMGAVLALGFVAGRLLVGPSTGSSKAATTVPHRFDIDGRRSLVLLIGARFLFLLGIYAVGRFLLLFVATTLGLDPDAAAAEAGLTLAALALVTVASSIPSGWLADRLGRRPLMIAGGVLAAAGMALLPSAASMELVLLFGGLMALGSAAFGSASWAMLADLVPAPEAGRLLGIANLGTAGAAAGAGAFGMLIDAGGYGIAFGVAAGCSLAGALVAWSLVDRVANPDRLVGGAEVAG